MKSFEAHSKSAKPSAVSRQQVTDPPAHLHDKACGVVFFRSRQAKSLHHHLPAVDNVSPSALLANVPANPCASYAIKWENTVQTAAGAEPTPWQKRRKSKESNPFCALSPFVSSYSGSVSSQSAGYNSSPTTEAKTNQIPL